MNTEQARQAENPAPVSIARFDYTPAAADYDRALWHYTLRSWPGRTRHLLPLYAAAAVAFAIRAWKWHFDQTEIVVTGTICAIAVLVVRQWFRRHRTRDQYATHAEHSVCLTTLGEDGLTTTGASGHTVTADWNSYPWWFETPDLFVLTGSMEFFFVLPKRGAACPEDLEQTRALFSQRLRRI
ncbi:YcxB family protein [Streptomyces sp. A1547]|uniref:YcxB family protein n=1 Tax=Streptomyces sp. A1547 TaxID=2563105 RepID=UPI00109E9387|nr:YcxB family protein [Streptomyces sp. A1547]THA39747.1 YcxB family protein [Streptomyces sp. A1547]